MRKTPTAAFTLLELLTVIPIIAILASLVLAVGGCESATETATIERAQGEAEILASACESYKADNGSYPRDIPAAMGEKSVTDDISPKQHFIPTDALYAASSLFLYKELTGDKTGPGNLPDGIPDEGEQRYIQVESLILNARRDPSTGKIITVNYIQDPFGFPYAYSTAAAKAAHDFQRKLMLGQPAIRPLGNNLPGFNAGSFDLWSTGGSTPKVNPNTVPEKNLEWAKWRKNW